MSVVVVVGILWDNRHILALERFHDLLHHGGLATAGAAGYTYYIH